MEHPHPIVQKLLDPTAYGSFFLVHVYDIGS